VNLSINGRFLTQQVTGVQRVARELVNGINELIEEGAAPTQSVQILAPKSPLIDPPRLSHIPIHQVGHLGGHAWEQWELSKAAGNEMLLCLGNTAPALRLMANQPTAVMVHDLSFQYFPQAYGLAFRTAYKTLMPLILARSSVLFAVSEAERTKISERYSKAARRMRVIENGGLPDHIADIGTNPRPRTEDYALYVGTLSKLKNAQGLLKTAVSLVRQEGVKFKIVGSSGSVFSQFDIQCPEDVKRNIEFVGQVNDPNELARFYQDAVCLVFPSHYESSGLPPMEAMSQGCPVICSDIPALRERCADAAVYCDPIVPESITEAVRKVIHDGELRSQMSRRGVERARHYRWKTGAAKLLNYLNETAAL